MKQTSLVGFLEDFFCHPQCSENHVSFILKKKIKKSVADLVIATTVIS